MGFTDVGRVRGGEGNLLAAVGLGMMLAGICIRWAAIRTLGRFFTRSVTILEGHRMVRGGLYKHLAAATLYRMRVEERALLERFGDEYLAHSRSTKRLIPKVF